MKKLLSLVLLVVASSASADDWPTRPFTFIGIPEKIRSETYETIHGKMQNMVIRVVEVKEGSYDKPEIGFDFPAGSKPPLEIGERYLFKAVYDRHGIRYTEWTKMKKKPNQSLEPTRTCKRACFRSGEIRILDSTGKLEHTIAFSEGDRKL